ncbi:glycosyl transferase group 1 [Prevotella sp. CAG:617]|nr:glycosyl transferase group 1 [Prevotella sp. CAG:617]
MKKILIFLHRDDSHAGGAEEIMYNLSRFWLEHGNQVDVLFFSPVRYGGWDSLNPNLCLYYARGGKFTRMFHLLYWFIVHRNIMYDYSFTSLVFHTSWLGIMRRIGLLKVKKMLARESTSIFNRFSGLKLMRMRLLYYLGYPAVNLLICQTDFMKDSLLSHQSWLMNYMKVCVIPNPISIEKIRKLEQEQIDICNYSPYIVAAGRYIPEKGFDLLIKAFSEFRKIYPHFHLLILGDGTERIKLQQLVENLQIKDFVHLYGFVDNVYPYFRQAEICVVSSRIEGFPNVLLQMMSQNNNVVSTCCAGGIENIKGLYVCETNDEKAILNSILDCYKNDNKECRNFFNEELAKRDIGSFVNNIKLALLEGQNN